MTSKEAVMELCRVLKDKKVLSESEVEWLMKDLFRE